MSVKEGYRALARPNSDSRQAGGDGFRVEVVGHATLRVCSNGRTLLTDPWLIDPVG